jgi:hypothetical protein
MRLNTVLMFFGLYYIYDLFIFIAPSSKKQRVASRVMSSYYI